MEGLEHWDKIIDDHPILTHEQEGELASRRDAGDEDAAGLLVLHNLRDLERKVRKMNAKACDNHDLFMAGMEGMRKAAERWQPMHDAKYKNPARFMSYSFLYVRDHMTRWAKKNWKDDVSLDAEVGRDGDATGHEVIDLEDLVGGESDCHDRMDLAVVEELPRNQREIFRSKVLEMSGDSDEDLGWMCRVKPENVNRHLLRAIMTLMERTGFTQRLIAGS